MLCLVHRLDLTKLRFTSTNSNVIVALVVGRVDVVYLMCNVHHIVLRSHWTDDSRLAVLGTTLSASANIFFAVVNPSQTYWAYGLPSAILSVFGADFVFAAGTLFIAKVALPHEQSVAGALFQTMTQVS